MKTTKMGVLLSVLLVSVGGVAHAGLYQHSTQIVVDDRSTASLLDDLFFYRDLSRFNDMTYVEQVAEIDLLNVELSGVGPWQDNWHLATSAEMAGLTSALASVASVFLPSGSPNYYSGRYESIPLPGEHMWFEVYPGYSPGQWFGEMDFTPDTSIYDGAWAVANPVPVPGAVLLGMIGLSIAGVKLRKRA